MNFVGGMITTLVAGFFIFMFYIIGYHDGRQKVAHHLKNCLEISSVEGICVNRTLDTYLPEKGN